MVTVGELLKTFKPGIIFGAILGLLVSIYLETLVDGEFSSILTRILEYNTASKGLFVIGVFVLIGFVVQWRLGWK